MKYLFGEWGNIKNKIGAAYIMLFLDYDGTLTPIIETPEKAVINRKMRELLRGLARLKRLKVAIISGRELTDVKKMVGVDGIIYVGNHGLEMSGPKIKFLHPISLKSRYIIEKIKETLCRKLVGIKGVLVEDKGLTFSIHYRLASPNSLELIKNIFNEATASYRLKKRIRVTYGKKVFEVRPPIAWDKGKVVLLLLARERFRRWNEGVMPIYVGDDVTDEDAFKALRNNGITVFVGSPRSSQAHYYLKDTGEACEFLKKILGLEK